jgi:sulfide:quinone oxidoreductase
VGAVQGASCFGPAYEYAFIMDTDLRRRKIRTKVPMTFATSEPYIGHLGLGGVGDSMGILESGMRDKHIKWICNAKVTKVETGKMFVTEHDEMGVEKREHELPFVYSMMLPAFKGVDAVFGIEGLTQARGFIIVDKHQRNTKHKNIYAVGVRGDPSGGGYPGTDRHTQDRLHYRVHDDGNGG